jgi:WD40 repeat protein/DNA-binding SARP family transcriptional activator
MPALNIQLLDTFFATYGDESIKGLDQARLQALFVYLLLHRDGAVSRQKIAYTFWPDSEEKQALNNLRTLFYRLRKSLPDADNYLSYDRHTLKWQPEEAYRLDVEEFENALVRAQTADEENDRPTMRAELENAAKIYSGDLLAANYEEWIETDRERLKQDYTAAIERLLALLEGAGEYEQAIGFARQLLRQNPLSETTYRRLMRLQAASGDRAGALQTFQQAQQMLAEKLGVDPSPETLALHIQTLQGEIGLGNVERDEQARQVAQQREELDGRYERLINTNVLLLELQREREEKTKLLSRLEQEMAESADRSFLDDQQNVEIPSPYMGLVAYEESDADYFFGREDLVAELTARLAGTPFLTVVGPSGSGKSSLVRAGLLPSLKAGGLPGSETWKTAVVTPGAHPLATLAVATAQLNGDTAGKLYRALQEESCALAQAVGEALEATGDEGGLLLVVDQFEELFALCRDDAERRLFVENVLCAAGEAASRLMVVLTVRADFYGRFADFPALAATQKDSLLIGAMDQEGLRAVIEKPAALAGLQLEPGLADTILEDAAGEPGALPLLSHALLETFRRREGRLMTLEGYRASGGIRGAIAQTADSVYQNMTPQEQAQTRGIFLRLTELGEEGAQDTRRRVEPGELVLRPEEETAVLAVLKTLADARLITTGEETVEVAHEALIREWPLLRQWLEEDREGLRIHRHLTETAQAWDELERDPGELYRGARLAVASEWAENHEADLNPLELEFLTASQELMRRREVERDAQRQRELKAAQRLAAEEQARADEQAEASKRLRRRAGYLSGALIAAAALALAALLLGRQANSNQVLAQNNAATAVVEAEIRSTAQAAAEFQEQEARAQEAVAVAASEQRATAQAEAEFQEEQAREQEAVAVAEAEQRATAQAQAENEQEIAISRELAAASQANLDQDPELSIMLALEALDVTHTLAAENALHQAVVTSHAEHTLSGHTDEPWDVAFDATGTRLVTSSGDQTARIWDVSTGEEIYTLNHDDMVVTGNFDPQGARVVTASYDGIAHIWDMETGEELQVLSSDDMEYLFEAVFSPDGRLLATSGDGTIIWDIESGEPVHTIADGLDFVEFSPDGEMFAASLTDVRVGIYDLDTGEELSELALPPTPNDSVLLAFSPDGQYLSTQAEGVVRLWGMDRGSPETFGQELMSFPGIASGSSAPHVGFSPDSTKLFALGADNEVRTWDIESGQELSSFVCHLGANAMAVSPDGERVAVGASGPDHATKICSLGMTYEWSTLTGHDDWLYHTFFSPDGSTLYTASRDGTVKGWDMSEKGVFGYGQEMLILESGEEGNRF